MARQLNLFLKLKNQKLPYYFDYPIPNKEPLKVCVDHFDKSHVPTIYEAWTEALAGGDGFGIGEDFSYIERAVLEEADPRYKGFVMLDVDKSEVMAARILHPSGSCRSENTVMTGGFILVNKVYRKMKIAELLLHFHHPHYHGGVGRVAVTSNNVKPTLRSNVWFYGTIPWSTELTDQGWIHDNLVAKLWTDPHEKAKNVMIPKLADRDEIETRLPMFTRSPLLANCPSLHHHTLGNIKVTAAKTSEIWMVQEIIRDMALSGDGFGLDEFTADGVYNERLIRDCSYWVVRKESDQEVLGVILAGDSGLCRSHNKEQVAGAVLVLKPFRGQGLGKQLLKWCEDQWWAQGYKYVLTDMLACNMPGLALVTKSGYSITGTIPWTCVVNRRYVDSFILWKSLSKQVGHFNQ